MSCVLGAAPCPSVGSAGNPASPLPGEGHRRAPPAASAVLCRASLPWPVPVASPSGTRRPPALTRVLSPASHRSCCPSLPVPACPCPSLPRSTLLRRTQSVCAAAPRGAHRPSLSTFFPFPLTAVVPFTKFPSCGGWIFPSAVTAPARLRSRAVRWHPRKRAGFN